MRLRRHSVTPYLDRHLASAALASAARTATAFAATATLAAAYLMKPFPQHTKAPTLGLLPLCPNECGVRGQPFTSRNPGEPRSPLPGSPFMPRFFPLGSTNDEFVPPRHLGGPGARPASSAAHFVDEAGGAAAAPAQFDGVETAASPRARGSERSVSPPTNPSPRRQLGRSASPPPKRSPPRRVLRSANGSRGEDSGEGAPQEGEAEGTARPPRVAAGGGVTVAPPVSSGGPVTTGGLEWEVGTVLDVFWKAEEATFRGFVEEVDVDKNGAVVYDDNGAVHVLVYYPVDNTHRWHNFDRDCCSFTIVQPAAHSLARIRRTAGGYDGQVVPGARWYAMEAEYVERHYERCGEPVWLSRLSVGGEFVGVPYGAKRHTKTEGPVHPPYCVLGSLAKALRHVGNVRGAEVAEADAAASLELPPGVSRLKWAATRAHLYGCQATIAHSPPDLGTAEHPTLLAVSRSHVVAVLGELLFDSTEPKPLPLTQAMLDRCVGAPCTTAIVRGYMFAPLRLSNKRPTDGHAAAEDLLICQRCQLSLSKETFSGSQLRKKALRRCPPCLRAAGLP